jgi:hypothetical protein
VTDIETPMTSAKLVNGTLFDENRGYGQSARAAPSSSGGRTGSCGLLARQGDPSFAAVCR